MRTAFSQQLKKLSLGFLKSTVDLALFTLAFGTELAFSGAPSSKNVYSAANWADGMTVDSLKRAIRRLNEKGWIKKDLTITREGQRRLKNIFPQPRKYPKKWNGIWHLVSFDIPQQHNFKRDRLREALKKISFGKLHESLWISPYNFLGDVEDYLQKEYLSRYTILATSKELGTQRSKQLANDVFGLDKLNLGYYLFIGGTEKAPKETLKKLQLIFQYFDLLKRDPFLPYPLLPEDWQGEEAQKLFAKCLGGCWKKFEQGDVGVIQ